MNVYVVFRNYSVEGEMQEVGVIYNIYASEGEAKRAVEMYTRYDYKGNKSKYYYEKYTVFEKCPTTIDELRWQGYFGEEEEEE